MIVIAIIGLDILWHIWEYKERKRLDKCWTDLFNHKLDSDMKWKNLCSHYVEKICELTETKGGDNDDR